jgi:hypothetical protein
MSHKMFFGGKQQLGCDFLIMPKKNPYVQVAWKGSNHVNTLSRSLNIAQ